MGRKIGWYVSIAVLVLTGVLGLLNEPGELKSAVTALQMSVAIGGLAYSLVGLVAAAALIRKAPSARWLTLLWTGLVAYVSSAATLAYAGDDATVGGAIAAGLGAAVLGLAIHWQARAMTQEPNAVVDARSAAVR